MGKIISKEEAGELQELKKAGKKLVLCHGVFDLVHPGHIIHFQEAKKLGDILIVSVTAEKYVRKGPGRPYFNDELRMKFLEAISCIDYVMLSENEWNRLAQLGNKAWLYIVVNCKTTPELYRIQNPAERLSFEKMSKGVQYYLPLEEWQQKYIKE